MDLRSAETELTTYLTCLLGLSPLAAGEEEELVAALATARAAGADLAAGAGLGDPLVSRALDRLVKDGVHAERRLVESHLRIVPPIAEMARAYAAEPLRTIARGNEALWLSVRSFPADGCTPFVEHATDCVRAALLDVATAAS